MDCDLIAFKELIESKTGIKVSDDERLSSAIAEMVVYNSLKSEKELLTLIGREKKFLENLVGLLTINETYFFRESGQIEVFANKLIPGLVKQKKMSKINIISAGCSTGAEPYTLVIALMEKFGFHISHLFSIKAFDIDRKALKTAEKGVYGKYSFRGTDSAIIAKYFDSVSGERYKIKPFVKEMVDFYPHNLLEPSPPELLNSIDIIFYRNVAIYFSPENQKKAFMNLESMLNDNGWLMMSSAETLSHDDQTLALKNINDVFLFRKENFSRKPVKRTGLKAAESKQMKPITEYRPFSDKADSVDTDASETLSAEERIAKAENLIRKKEYSKALKLIEALNDEGHRQADIFIMKASALTSLNRFDEANKACLKALAIDEFSLESYFLRGVIARLEKDLAGAEEHFKKMLYIDSSSWLANFYLAEIYREQGDTENSYKKYEAVIRQVKKNKFRERDFLYGTFVFSEKELIQACKINMEKLEQK